VLSDNHEKTIPMHVMYILNFFLFRCNIFSPLPTLVRLLLDTGVLRLLLMTSLRRRSTGDNDVLFGGLNRFKLNLLFLLSPPSMLAPPRLNALIAAPPSLAEAAVAACGEERSSKLPLMMMIGSNIMEDNSHQSPW
jgi:hypothetical protein